MSEDLAQNQPTAKAPRRANFLRKLRLSTVILSIATAVQAIILITLIVLCAIGKVSIISTSKTHISALYNVCGDKLIERWNKAMDFHGVTDDKKAKQRFSNLTAIADDVRKIPNSDKDATCQYMIYQDALYRNDGKVMKSTADIITKLNQQGGFISDKVLLRMSLHDIQEAAKAAH